MTLFGLGKAYCEVSENETDITVCATVKSPYDNTLCPVRFKFDLQFEIDSDPGRLSLTGSLISS